MLTGDWKAVEALVNSLKAEIVEANNQALAQAALKGEGIAKEHISKQDLNWTPLKAATVSAKVKKGQSENILVATSTYFQSITSWHTKGKAYVGIKKQVVEEDGALVADIARTLEYGSVTRNIPERPLWQPTMKEVIKWMQDGKNKPSSILLERLNKYKR